MAAHLAHKLPWGNLAELFLLHAPPDAVNAPRPYMIKVGEREKNKAAHFARCLASAVRDFRASDDCSDDERRPYDPRTWPGQRESGAGAWVGFYESIIGGYVHLNLILYDPAVFLPRLVPTNSVRNVEWFRWMLGHHDGGHPQELADHLQLAFDGYELRPLTREVTQVLRDHAAMLFRCMFSISGVNKFIDDEVIEWHILNVCRVQYPTQLSSVNENERVSGV